jgi:hypothetical protein
MSSYSIGQIVNVIKTHDQYIKTLANDMMQHDSIIKKIDPEIISEVSAEPTSIYQNQLSASEAIMQPITKEKASKSAFSETVLGAATTSLYALDPKPFSSKVLNAPLHIMLRTNITTKTGETTTVYNRAVDVKTVGDVVKSEFLSVYAANPQNFYTFAVLNTLPLIHEDPSVTIGSYGIIQFAKMKVDNAVFRDYSRMTFTPLDFDKLKDETTHVIEIAIKDTNVHQSTLTETEGQITGYSWTQKADRTYGHLIFEMIGKDLCLSGYIVYPFSSENTINDDDYTALAIDVHDGSVIEANYDKNIIGAMSKLLTYSELAKKGKASEYAMDAEIVKTVNKFVAIVNRAYHESFTIRNAQTGKVESRLTDDEVAFVTNLHSTFESLRGFKYVRPVDDPQARLSTDPVFIEPTNIWTGSKYLDV